MIWCKECAGTGEVIFTKEKGGPRCNNCGGEGVISEETTKRVIASILDGSSVYMGGPSKQSLKRAGRIVDYLVEQGFFD